MCLTVESLGNKLLLLGPVPLCRCCRRVALRVIRRVPGGGARGSSSPGLVDIDVHGLFFVWEFYRLFPFSFLRLCEILNLQIIEANLNGDLNLKIESELVCVTTHFKDLGNPPSGKFCDGFRFASGIVIVSEDTPG